MKKGLINNLGKGLKKTLFLVTTGFILYGCPSMPELKPQEELICQLQKGEGRLEYSTDRYELIPYNASPVYEIDLTGNGIPDIYWWDKDKNNIVQDNELFLDINEDRIPDINYRDFREWFKNQAEAKFMI